MACGIHRRLHRGDHAGLRVQDRAPGRAGQRRARDGEHRAHGRRRAPDRSHPHADYCGWSAGAGEASMALILQTLSPDRRMGALANGQQVVKSFRYHLTDPRQFDIMQSGPCLGGRMRFDQLKRREFLTLLGGVAAWPLAARAQQPKMPRLGFVGIQPRDAPLYTNFLRRMAELGYQEGRNFTFDYIQTPNVEGYERHYRELAARKVDVFLAVGNEPALRAALSAADGRPIAFLAVDFDPL